MSQIEAIMGSKGAMIGLAVVAFLVAAILVLVIVRMLFGGRLRMPGGRARQARLGIVDAFDLDRQRQLIIVRRDNTEHLIMIGGPNDLLIESEIVRVEARDVRDQRRDVGFQSDGRIPAPSPGDPRALDLPPEPEPRGDEPMLPMALPEIPQVAPPQPVASPQPVAEAPAPARAPTFPLPPRRPAPIPERRPPPPMLPEGVSRDGDLAAGSSVPPPGSPMMPPPQVNPPAVATPVANAPGGTAPPLTAPARTVPPPFLKPLPPRPPLRPLQRATPVPPTPPGDAAASPPPKVVAPPPPKPAAPTQLSKPVASTPAAPESNDALESLEEEMAKLLGRGPG